MVLLLEEKRVEIRLEHRCGRLSCPECRESATQADLVPERAWRHLDAMQFTTERRARVPRPKCASCGVKTVSVPWAGKHSRFTLMFEAFAISFLQTCSNVKRDAELLKLNRETVHLIMERGVSRGLEKLTTESVKRVGMDEKTIKKEHSYVSLMTDIDSRRVFDLIRDITEESAEKHLET